MMKALRFVFGTLALAAAVLFAVFTFGMRTKSPRVLGTIRRFNKAYMNPRQRDAGTPGAYASLIRHTGRTSGTSYETPIVATATEDGFVIALPYGSQADWLKNVLAGESATIVHGGDIFDVGQPELIPTETADAYFSPNDQRAHRLFGTDQCLRLRHIGPDQAAVST